jgi:hypothetical protein
VTEVGWRRLIRPHHRAVRQSLEEVRLVLEPFENDLLEKPLIVGARLVAFNRRQIPEMEQNGADVRVLELDRLLRPLVQVTPQAPVVLGLVDMRSGQLRLEHGEVVRHDALDFVTAPGPRHPML